VTDAGRTTFSYGAAATQNFLVFNVTSPFGGRYYTYISNRLFTANNPANGNTTFYSYESHGLLSRVNDQQSGEVTVAYGLVDGAYRVTSLELAPAVGTPTRWVHLQYGAPDPAVCGTAAVHMTTVTDPQGTSKYCSDANYQLIDVDGDGQGNEYDDQENETDGTLVPELGDSAGDLSGPAALAAPSVLAITGHCGRNSYEEGGLYDTHGVPFPGFAHVWTFRIKYTRSGETEHGDPYRQYHIHWQIRSTFAANTARSWLRVTRTLPGGTVDPSPFDDSDTRIAGGRPDPKTWYAHFLRLKVKPFTTISYHAFSQWRGPYVLPGGYIYTGQTYTGACTAHLNY
jgi:hypothetical protein